MPSWSNRLYSIRGGNRNGIKLSVSLGCDTLFDIARVLEVSAYKFLVFEED